MMTFGSSRIGAAILGGLLSIPALHAALPACKGGDLVGKWSHYASIYQSPRPLTLRCNVTLTNGGGNQAHKYSISGSCKAYSTNAAPLDLQVGGSLSLEETSACKLQGAYAIGQSFPIFINILDARIEGGLPKQRITGVSRIDAGSGHFQLLRFRFQR